MNKKYIDAYKEIIEQGFFNKLKTDIKGSVKNLFKGGAKKNNQKAETLLKFYKKYNLKSLNNSNVYQKKLNNSLKFQLTENEGNKNGDKTHRFSTLTCKLIDLETNNVLREEDIEFKYTWPLKELEQDIKTFLQKSTPRISLSDLAKIDYSDIKLNRNSNSENNILNKKFQQQNKSNNRNNDTKNSPAAKRRQVKQLDQKLKQILNKLTPEQRQFLQNSLKDQ